MEKVDCEKIAQEVREKYNPQNLSPFPYQNVIAANVELTVAFFPFSGEGIKSLSGAIYFDIDANKFNISINEDQAKTRQYFTLAHELGHYFLHKDEIKKEGIIVDTEFFDGNRALLRPNELKESSILETEANQFAAALIMPADLVKRAWEELKSVEECAKVFNVSTSAMSIRLERLHLLDI